ncbi:hypothetical protein IJZ97_02320 [bacterium]|nr:hypothetical protein [bacterium]
MAVCDGAIFKGSYVDKTAYHTEGTLNYQDPSKLQYGQVIDVTKQAPGAFKTMPEGTKIQTLEGTRTVQQGEVVALDHAGNPYATTPANIAKRNTGFSVEAQKELLALQGVELKRTMFHGERGDSYKAIETEINGEPHYKVFDWGSEDFADVYPTIDTQEGAQSWLLNNWNKGQLSKGELPSSYGDSFSAQVFRETRY